MVSFINSIIPLCTRTQVTICIYTWRIPLAFDLPLPVLPCSPLYPLPLTWHPPAVTGIVHLRLRLLVN
jgi:hypothetical protein